MNSPLLQPAAFLAMVYGGALAGAAYDACRLLRRLCRHSIITILSDGVFVLLGTALLAFSLLWATGGAFRPYTAVAFFLGFALEQVTFSRIFFKLFHKLLEKLPKKTKRQAGERGGTANI